MARLLQVDAFTEVPFGGNPAAVCLLGEGPAPSDAWMQALAAEMNLSETAFVRPCDGRAGAEPTDLELELRWFTPENEVELCGHATLASAHALWEEGVLTPAAAARFHTKSGLLTCRRQGALITMDFPREPLSAAPPPAGLLQALGVTATWTGKNRLHFTVEVSDAAVVRGLSPDFARLRAVDVRAVAVTAPSDEADVDFVSRFFAPREGIDEDPVTGSAHSGLGEHWGARLGKTRLRARQVSARAGLVDVELSEARVALSGSAVTVFRGELGVSVTAHRG
jgi:PhzF family phenazine biosynthesis protein